MYMRTYIYIYIHIHMYEYMYIDIFVHIILPPTQCVAVCCNVLQYAADCCSVLLCVENDVRV